jgi:hypothetical protein
MHENLPTPYHQQDTNYYCGAACAQMVLDTVGSGLLSQDDLYADNHSHSTTESGWYTAPDGLQWTLNNRQTQTYFALDALTTEDAISRMIVWTIHHYRVAPIAMVFGSAHWIAIRGYTASASPANSVDTSYSIDSFDVNNPWPPTPLPGPPPPHSSGDVCGSGGSRGIADENISYATWQADYMTGIPGGYWGGKFVALCDPSPPPKGLPLERRHTPRAQEGERLIDAEAAAKRAREALRALGLDKRERWSDRLKATRFGAPIMVQRLDRLDSFYWIVPMNRQRRLSAAVSIDARSGEYRQAFSLPEPLPNPFGFAQHAEVLKLIVDQRFELAGAEGRLRVREDALCVYPHYVWRPCLESLSPFYPFRMVTIGNHRLYIRTDGAVFTSLTLGLQGI